MQTAFLHTCTARGASIPANIVTMEQVEDDHRFIRALVDWTARSVSRVASEVGVSPSTINRHYNATATTKLSRDTLMKLRDKWPDFPGWLSRNNNVRSEVASFGDRPFDEKYGSGELPAIPVLGSAMAAASFDPEHDIELTEVNMAEVMDTVRRPASLADDDKAYAVTVIGDSMWPRFRPGRRVIVSPRATISIGDDVIVQLRGTEGDSDYKNRVATVLIKELVRRSASYIELRQFNPDQTFKVDTNRVAAIHKVVGEVY